MHGLLYVQIHGATSKKVKEKHIIFVILTEVQPKLSKVKVSFFFQNKYI